MPTPWKREPVYMPKSPSPSFQKPSISMFERLGLKAPPKKPATGPSASDPLGFLGGGYANEQRLRGFLRKEAEYKYHIPKPNVYRKLGKKQRGEYMKELLLRAREIMRKEGQIGSGGKPVSKMTLEELLKYTPLSEDRFKKVLKKVEGVPSILGGPPSEIGGLRSKGQLNKAKELEIRAQVWKKWARGKYK